MLRRRQRPDWKVRGAHARRRGVALVALCALVLASGAQEAPPLATVAAVRESVTREVGLYGVLEAVNQSTVAAQTDGRVEEIAFDVGDYVEQGQVILRLSAVEQRARLSSAQAAVSEARARFAEAELAYRRAREVFDRGLIAKSALDAAAANLESARSRVGAAVAAEREARETTRYTEVRAPYSGYVVKRHIEIGETATVGAPLMTGLSLERLRARVEVPQAHIAALRDHRRARVELPDGRILGATDLRLPPNADPTTHTFRVLVALPDGEHGVFPGTLVKVRFTSGADEQVLIPAAAVVQRSEVTAAYVVGDEQRVEFRYVRTGTPTEDGRIPILAGLAAGERVAVDPIAAGIRYQQQPLPAAAQIP